MSEEPSRSVSGPEVGRLASAESPLRGRALAAQPEVTRALVQEALAGAPEPVGQLVRALTPVIQGRVARCLLARGVGRTRPLREEVEDLCQDVLLKLFAEDGKVLRAWQPERGLSLPAFVALVAERLTLSTLRSGRKSGWREDPTLDGELDGEGDEPSPERRSASREQLERLLDRLKEELSPLGRCLFQLLFVEEASPAEVVGRTGLSADAVYAWRSRLRKLAGRLLDEISETGPPRRIPLRGGDDGT